MKKTLIILIILVGLAGIWLSLRFIIGGSEDTWICVDGQWVKHGNSNAPMPTEPCGKEPLACTMDAKLCSDGSYVARISPDCQFSPCPGEKEGILISSPKSNEKIKSPLKIEGQARGFWFFEAQFNAVLLDARGNKLREAILTTKSDWMTDDFLPFTGKLNFIQPSTSWGTLRFLSANPSGLPENQRVFEIPVQFEEVPAVDFL